jgi:hypothetical protein
VHTGWLHGSMLPRILHSCMTFRIGTPRLVVLHSVSTDEHFPPPRLTQ